MILVGSGREKRRARTARGWGEAVSRRKGVLDDGQHTMSEPVLWACHTVCRRPAGPDLPVPVLSDEAAGGAGGGRVLGLDGPHQAIAPWRGWELGTADQPSRAPGAVEPGRGGGRRRWPIGARE